MSGAKTMDNASVQTLIDKLRDLSSSKFAEKGGGDQVFEATVTSNSGKRVEKVMTISKLGDQYFAKREERAEHLWIRCESRGRPQIGSLRRQRASAFWQLEKK